MKFNILTIFPDIFDSYLNESLMKRAQEAKLIKIDILNIRDYSKDKHNKTDDRPFGGGPGMVMAVQPIYDAIRSLTKKKHSNILQNVGMSRDKKKQKSRVILFSLRGKKLDEKMAKRLAKYDELTLICGRYEGVDERVAEKIADEEISIGDYVLAGGELPALVLMEAVARFIPGFLGKYESLEALKGSYPSYTRPPEFKTKEGKIWKVPKVLQSGNHSEIEKWRKIN